MGSEDEPQPGAQVPGAAEGEYNVRRRTMFELRDPIPEGMETSGGMAPDGTNKDERAEEDAEIEKYFSSEVSIVDQEEREQTGTLMRPNPEQAQVQARMQAESVLAQEPGNAHEIMQRCIAQQVTEQVQEGMRGLRRSSELFEQQSTMEMQAQRKMLESINATLQAQAPGNGRDMRPSYAAYDGPYGTSRGQPMGFSNGGTYGVKHVPSGQQPNDVAGMQALDPATVTMIATAVSQASTIMANNHSHADKVSFTSVKDTDDAAQTILRWERQFQAANIPVDQWVKKALALMGEGGNLRNWAQNYENKCPGRTNHDPAFIHNWTWEHFVAQLRDSNLWKDVEPATLLKRMMECTCDPEGDETAIVAYVTQFQNCKAELDAHDLLHPFFTEAGLATQLFSNLPSYFRKFMNRRREPGPSQQLRYGLTDTIAEIRKTQSDAECKWTMQQKIKQPKANASTIPTRLGQTTDHIGFFTSTSAMDVIKSALETEQHKQGPSMELQVKKSRQPGQHFIMVTHPSSEYLAKLPQTLAPLQLAWAGNTHGPRPNHSGGRKGADNSVTSQTLANVAHQMAEMRAAQVKLDDMVSKLSATDAAPSSVITPSDSVSQVAVPAANTVLASNALAPAARQYQRPSINWGESASKSPLSYSAHIPAHIPDSMNMGGG